MAICLRVILERGDSWKCGAHFFLNGASILRHLPAFDARADTYPALRAARRHLPQTYRPIQKSADADTEMPTATTSRHSIPLARHSPALNLRLNNESYHIARQVYFDKDYPVNINWIVSRPLFASLRKDKDRPGKCGAHSPVHQIYRHHQNTHKPEE